MVTKTNAILILLSIFLLNSCHKNTVKGPHTLPDKEKLKQFNAGISAITKDLNIQSYAFAILSNTEILELKEEGIGKDQIFQTGELSNLFISMLALQSSEEKLLDTRDYLSEYNVQGDRGKAQIKNLLSFTWNAGNQIINFSPDNFRLIGQVVEQVEENSISKIFKNKIGKKLSMKHSAITDDGKTYACSTSLDDLILFSEAIDNQKLFEDEYTQNLMFRPVYLESGERSPSGLGCYIDITDDKKMIWSFGTTEAYSALLLKSVTDSISLIVVAETGNLNSPFKLQNGDINRSPVVHQFRKLLPNRDSVSVELNFYSDDASIRKGIQESIKADRRDAAYDELTAFIRLYKWNQNSARLTTLLDIYQEFFPNDIPVEKVDQEPLVSISRVIDYMQLSRTFTLKEDALINIYTTGEFTKEMSLSPWEYDNIEIYFDLNHERTGGFNSGDDDRQYRINYDYPRITGTAPSFENITSVQYDVSPTRFNFEIAIPWTVLFNSDSVRPELDQFLGFDIAIADNDADVREGSLAWQSVLNEQPWANTSTYGSMALTKSAGATSDTICYAMATSAKIMMDGQNTGEWNGVPRYQIDKPFMEGITGPDDQSGWFKAQWDNENLYFLVEIEDDVKRIMEKSGDFGWITSAAGDTIWMMQEKDTQYAGGAISNRQLNAQIPMKAGDYVLHYNSNQTHSYGRWVNERPDLSYYGIIVF